MAITQPALFDIHSKMNCPQDISNNEDSTLFDSLKVELKVPVDPKTNEALLNKRSAKFFATKAHMDINNYIILTTAEKIITVLPSTPLKCSDLSQSDVEIPATFDHDTGKIKMDLTNQIRQGDDFAFSCNFHLDFTQFKSQSIETALSNDASLKSTTTIDPIDDKKSPPSELFDTFRAVLSQLENKVINTRAFQVIGTGLEADLNEKIPFHFGKDILFSQHETIMPTCSWGEGSEKTAEVQDLKQHGFYLDFTTSPIPKGTETFELKCTNLFLDFTNARALVIPLQILSKSHGNLLSIANLGPIDEGSGGEVVKWPLKLDIPIRAEYQPFITLNIDNIPSQEETGTNELSLFVSFLGAQLNDHKGHPNNTLHHITLTSYLTEKVEETPTQHVLPIVISRDGVIDPIALSFPKHHIRLGASIQIATVKTLDELQVDIRLKAVHGNRRHYYPNNDTKLSWKSNGSIFETPPHETVIKTTFKSYLGQKGNGNYGPSFSLQFPNTGVALKDALVSLRTNNTLPFIDTTPSFFFNNKTKTQECVIPEFAKAKIPVTSDQYNQQLIFDLSGINQLEKAGKAFTLKCTNFATIIANPDYPQEPITFLLSTTIGGHTYSNSWIATPPSDHKSHVGLIFAIFIILFATCAAAVGAYFGYKWYKKRSLQMNTEEPLLGSIQ